MQNKCIRFCCTNKRSDHCFLFKFIKVCILVALDNLFIMSCFYFNSKTRKFEKKSKQIPNTRLITTVNNFLNFTKP